MIEPEVFRKQIYCLEECTCDTVGTLRRPRRSFGAPYSDSAPGQSATVTADGYVVLILLLQLQTRSQFMPATKGQVWHG